MKSIIAAAAVALLTTSALAQGSNAKISQATQSFVNRAAVTDMFEVEAGKLAGQRSTNDAFKDFAKMTVDDHGKTTEQLKTMAASLPGLNIPNSIDSAHTQKLQKLQNLTEAPFDRQYKADQVQGHQEAVRLFETYARAGDNPDLKKWAANTLPKLKEHLQHAQALKPGTPATTGKGSRQ